MRPVRRPSWVSRYEFASLVETYGGVLAADGESARLPRPSWVSPYEFDELVNAYT